MKVIIDTNTIISIIPRNSKYNSVFVDLVKGKYSITITTEIYLEYEEILLQKSNPIAAKAFFDFLINSKHVETITVFYYWRLITIDPRRQQICRCSNCRWC
jgi:predicted nucleic acid-binding protein